MTNAARKAAAADARPLDYIGIDMAKARFEWGVHGARSTRSATHDAAGFGRCWRTCALAAWA